MIDASDVVNRRPLRPWLSKSELDEWLRKTDRKPIQIPAPRDFQEWATVEIDERLLVCALAVPAEHLSVAHLPEWQLHVVGLNSSLHGLDLNRSEVVFTEDFGTSFFEFVDVRPDRVTAVFETGLLSVGPEGGVRWHRGTDLVTDFHCEDGEIVLTLMDDENERVSLD